jgi:hypothetical protein
LTRPGPDLLRPSASVESRARVVSGLGLHDDDRSLDSRLGIDPATGGRTVGLDAGLAGGEALHGAAGIRKLRRGPIREGPGDEACSGGPDRRRGPAAGGPYVAADMSA